VPYLSELRFEVPGLKNNKKYLLPALLMLHFASHPAASQTISQKYDLNFSNIASCNPSWLGFRRNCFFSIDSGNLRIGKPSFKLFYVQLVKGESMQVNLSRIIILPLDVYKRDEFSIISKDDVDRPFWFSVTGLDKNEQAIGSKLIKINSRSWKENTVKIKLRNVKAVRISISYIGDSSEKQDIWIDRILIRAGGKDITRSNYFSDTMADTLKIIKGIDKKHLIPLAIGNDSTLLSDVKNLKKKRIIGIGECTHGSNTVRNANYQFIKNLIVSDHCRLVLLEMPIDRSLLLNLYIQGKLSPNYSKQIEGDIKCMYADYDLFMRFLDWLKGYNSHTLDKVYLYGIDNPSSFAKLYLFSFHLALQGKVKGQFYLKKVAEEKYDDMLTQARLDTSLRTSLGKQNFECYLSILKNEISLHRSDAEFVDDRDSNMSIRVNDFINICVKTNEKAAILAHSGHLQNLERPGLFLAKEAPLGFYLRKKYGDQYFSISFQIGQGTFTQDECTGTKTITQTLPSPPSFSFEYASLATGLPYFYYPARHLGNAILSTCFITRNSRYADLYKFNSLKKEFDAYVFIKESKPIEKIEYSISGYAIDYFYAKRKAMDSILNEMKN
jgi:erythromycin esterase-like protein